MGIYSHIPNTYLTHLIDLKIKTGLHYQINYFLNSKKEYSIEANSFIRTQDFIQQAMEIDPLPQIDKFLMAPAM
jgi:hypothetical protein